MTILDTASYTFPTGDWQWIASFLIARANEAAVRTIEPEYTTVTGGITIEWKREGQRVLFISVAATKKETLVAIHGTFFNWKAILNDCVTFERIHRGLMSSDLDQRCYDLLVEYYDRLQRGRNPKLSEMAEEYGVPYGRLRKYKMGFDKEVRQIEDMP